jgi:ADP-heptose:LPS heptosyltransferase
MIFFRVSQNINIKIADGTLINYLKFKEPSNMENETLFVTTDDDFKDINNIFERVDKDKYFTRTLNKEKIKVLENFPIELGIINVDEDNNIYQDIKAVDIYKQLKNIKKDEISIAIIGGVGVSISEIISSCTSLRILHKKLKEVYKNIKFDIFINASSNNFYTRDKEIYQTQKYINNILPLSLNSKKLCEYDYFIDNSQTIKTLGLNSLNSVDAWLYKFGINYKKIDSYEKYNEINLSDYKVPETIKNRLKEAKSKGKLLLFHPYSANINKSIPQAIANELIKELLLKAEDYMIISTLAIDAKIKDDRFLDFTKESKNISDFIYIVSNMDKIITADTSTYHISDAFMIPTITIFTDKEYEKKIKYYKYIKPIYIENKTKNLSKFVYENENLTLNKLKAWRKLKVEKIIKLLDTF